MSEAKFSLGQIIHHKLFAYRGLIIDVDFKFMANDEWYDEVALSRPSKDQPWYHVLVDKSIQQTYVAECNLELSDVITPIYHPMLDHFFSNIENGKYQPRTRQN